VIQPRLAHERNRPSRSSDALLQLRPAKPVVEASSRQALHPRADQVALRARRRRATRDSKARRADMPLARPRRRRTHHKLEVQGGEDAIVRNLLLLMP
jgi:hypothetical protein